MYLGSDGSAWSTQNAEVESEIYDSGFHELDYLSTGRYLTLRRYGPSLTSSSNEADLSKYVLSELRVYEVPNLLEQFDVKITADSSPSISSFS